MFCDGWRVSSYNFLVAPAADFEAIGDDRPARRTGACRNGGVLRRAWQFTKQLLMSGLTMPLFGRGDAVSPENRGDCPGVWLVVRASVLTRLTGAISTGDFFSSSHA